jgi:ribonuclease-3
MQIITVDTVKLINEIEKIIDYCFKNKELLITAFTHSSFQNETNDSVSYERLEFLGDAILNLCISEYLYLNNEMNEGEMSIARSKIICESSLYEGAKLNCFLEYIRLGKSMRNEQSINVSIAADVVEAVLGAVFLDSNYECSQKVVLKLLGFLIHEDFSTNISMDYKSKLQEYIQKKYSVTPRYKTVGSKGPDHQKIFIKAVVVKEEGIVETGEGRSMKEAEQNAAKAAVDRLGI